MPAPWGGASLSCVEEMVTARLTALSTQERVWCSEGSLDPWLVRTQRPKDQTHFPVRRRTFPSAFYQRELWVTGVVLLTRRAVSVGQQAGPGGGCPLSAHCPRSSPAGPVLTWGLPPPLVKTAQQQRESQTCPVWGTVCCPARKMQAPQASSLNYQNLPTICNRHS